MIDWVWTTLDEMTPAQLLQLMIARQQVFVVEQQCAYQDADELDQLSRHLLGRDQDQTLLAYARVNPPNTRYQQPSFGRVMTTAAGRGKGVGRELVQRLIDFCVERYVDNDILISAQTYLVPFYKSFGFEVRGEAYDEDGIEHVDMLLRNADAT